MSQADGQQAGIGTDVHGEVQRCVFGERSSSDLLDLSSWAADEICPAASAEIEDESQRTESAG